MQDGAWSSHAAGQSLDVASICGGIRPHAVVDMRHVQWMTVDSCQEGQQGRGVQSATDGDENRGTGSWPARLGGGVLHCLRRMATKEHGEWHQLDLNQ